jgi:hypothetical protein
MEKEKASRVKSALGGKKKEGKKSESKGGKKRVHRMHISRTANGKYLVEHEFKHDPLEPGPYLENEQHAVEPDELAQHVQEHMGGAPEPEPMPAGPAMGGPGGPPPPAPPMGV